MRESSWNVVVSKKLVTQKEDIFTIILKKISFVDIWGITRDIELIFVDYDSIANIDCVFDNFKW